MGIANGYIETKINSTGGICITNYANICDCYNAATIVGVGYVGGICGMNYGIIINCYNKGSITNEYGYVGGEFVEQCLVVLGKKNLLFLILII